MLKINEEFLQFIWQHKLLKPLPYITQSGKEISIIKPGVLNRDAGPDFSDARLRLNGIELAGNIEVHVRSSDWLRHGHQHDKAYNIIILHAVYEHDMELLQNTEHNVEVLELRRLIDERTLERYIQLAGSKNRLPCEGLLKEATDLAFIAWLSRMTVERLEEKVKRLEDWFEKSKGDYSQVFYTALLRSFGFNINALPFELIARHLPFKILLKHADNRLQLEALLLGISGQLEGIFEDKYIQNLQNEFVFLKNKYALVTLQKEIFKFSRLRPSNFPAVRLVQFAALIHGNSHVFINPWKFSDLPVIEQRLNIRLQGYWKEHYYPGGNVVGKQLSFGTASAESIMINAIAPFLFFFSKKSGDQQYADKAILLLSALAFEKNAKTRLFSTKKSLLTDASISQGLINLYDNYCIKKACLHCGIACAVLKPGILRQKGSA